MRAARVAFVACLSLLSPLLRAQAPAEPRMTRPPALVAGVDVVYPDGALAAGRGGEVSLHLIIDADGRVQRVDVLTSPAADLAWAAMGAATGFLFAPALFCVPGTGDGETCDVPLAVAVDWHTTFAPPPPSSSGPAAAVLGVSGVVVDSDDALALADVEVVATAAASGVAVDGVTDEGGAFALSLPAPGRYRVGFWLSGYEPAFVEVDVTGAPRVLRVRMASHASHETVVRHSSVRFDDRPMQSASVLGELELRSVRGLPLADAIAEVPGVSVLASGPQVHKPVLHGQYGRRLLTVFDGVRHESQEWGVDHAPELDPFAATRITVVKGPAGVRYGPDAVGGAVLLDPPPLRDEIGVDGTLTLVGASNGGQGTVAGRVDAVPVFLPGATLRLETNFAKGAAVSTPDYVLGNTGSEVFNVGVTAGYRADVFEQAVAAQLELRRFRGTYGICFCQVAASPEVLQDTLIAKNPPNSDQWITSYDLDRPRQEITHDLVIARVRSEVFSLGAAEASYSFQRDLRDEFDQVRRSVIGPQYSFDLTVHALDLVFEHSEVPIFGAQLTGVAGVHGDLQRHEFSGLLLIPSYERAGGGLFAMERLRIPDVVLGDVEVEVGGRVDGLQQTAVLSDLAHTSLLRRGQLDDGDCDVNGDGARCGRSFQAATGTGGARWLIDLGPTEQALVLQGDVSQSTRFPDVDELYLGGRAPSFPVFGLGNGRLGPETTTQLSLAGTLRLPFVHVDAAAFVSHVDDYIAFGPDFADGAPAVTVVAQGAFPRFSSRAVDARFAGADASVVIAPDSLLSLAVQGSFVNGLDLTSGGFLPFVPPPRGQVELSSHLPDWGALTDSVASLTATGIARQERSDPRSDFAPPPDGALLWGAGLSTSVAVGDLAVHVGLEGRNLTNTRYRDALSLLRFYVDQPGRELWLRAQVDLK